MKLITYSILIVFGLIGNCYGHGVGSLSILDYSAPALEFVEANIAELRSSDLFPVVALSAGLTPDTTPSFNGLRVKNPFKPIKCYHIVAFDGSDLPQSQSPTQYRLNVDSSIEETFLGLEKEVKHKSLHEPTIIKKEISITDEDSLKREFEKLGSHQKTKGTVLTLISVKVEGKAKDKLMSKVEAMVRKISSSACGTKERLAMSLRVDPSEVASFRSRRALALDAVMAKPSSDLNLGTFYSGDYPVIFNIILFLAIVLIIFVVAVSAAMATMDPGRDSIIYRMTNPRMKKDQ